MSEIPQARVDAMMIKCNRRCCICRRFRPTKLQVHHIKEQAKGGTHDEDNLIAICLSCHSDVHANVPFARRFTEAELKGHRDATVKAVEEGRLTASDVDDTDLVMLAVTKQLQQPKPGAALLPEAAEMLVQAARSVGSSQGIIEVRLTYLISLDGGTIDSRSVWSISAGTYSRHLHHDEMRSLAKVKHAIEQLRGCGLVEQKSEGVFYVTYEGYLYADELMSAAGQPKQQEG